MTYLGLLARLPCFGGDQRIIHKIELSSHSQLHHQDEQGKNDTESRGGDHHHEISVANTQQGYIDATRSLGYSSKPKEEK